MQKTGKDVAGIRLFGFRAGISDMGFEFVFKSWQPVELLRNCILKNFKGITKKFNAVSLLPKRRCIAMVYKNGTTPLASSPFK
jgi:hypothetical protein